MAYDILKTDRRLERAIIGGGVYGSGSKSKKKCSSTMRNKVRKKYWGENKWKGECFCCGKLIQWGTECHAGRIKAGACGGEYTIPNTRLVCSECNDGMHKTNMKVYMKKNFPERYKAKFGEEEKQNQESMVIIGKKLKKKKHSRKSESAWDIADEFKKKLSKMEISFKK